MHRRRLRVQDQTSQKIYLNEISCKKNIQMAALSVHFCTSAPYRNISDSSVFLPVGISDLQDRIVYEGQL